MRSRRRRKHDAFHSLGHEVRSFNESTVEELRSKIYRHGNITAVTTSSLSPGILLDIHLRLLRTRMYQHLDLGNLWVRYSFAGFHFTDTTILDIMRISPRFLMATPTAIGMMGFKPAPMALLPPIPLYRRLLRAHRKHLHREMRLLGDEYVKSEFRAHRNVENPVHIVCCSRGAHRWS